ELGHGQAALPGDQPDAERAERDGAPDAEAALPDEQGPDRFPAFAEVELVVGDDVVDPAADEAEDHGGHRQVHDGALLTAHRGPAALAPGDGGDDARQDAQRVEVDGAGADLEDSQS